MGAVFKMPDSLRPEANNPDHTTIHTASYHRALLCALRTLTGSLYLLGGTPQGHLVTEKDFFVDLPCIHHIKQCSAGNDSQFLGIIL